MVMLLGLSTFVSTSLGGLVALRSRDRLHLVLGFTAGVILGVVAFDVLPEIVKLSHATGTDFDVPMVALVVGFLGFHVIEKSILIHDAHENEYAAHSHPTVGLASAVALTGHSLADGIAIGLAFQVSSNVGLAVALAVIAHDFADGLNTVALMLSHGNSRKRSLFLLLVDAVPRFSVRQARCCTPCPTPDCCSTLARSPASCSTSAPATSSPRRTPTIRPA